MCITKTSCKIWPLLTHIDNPQFPQLARMFCSELRTKHICIFADVPLQTNVVAKVSLLLLDRRTPSKRCPWLYGSNATGTTGQRSLVGTVDRSGSVWRQRDSSASWDVLHPFSRQQQLWKTWHAVSCHHLPGSLSLETKTKTHSIVQNTVKEFHQWRETFFPVCPGFRRGCI